jgi:two-component system, LytTR family, sensor kinase
MNRWLTYENIWARNIIFGGLLFALVFTLSKFALDNPEQPNPSDFDKTWQFLLLYFIFFSYNYYVLRFYFLTKKYTIYACLTAIYLVILSFLMMYLEQRENGNMTPFFGQFLGSFLNIFISSATYFAHTWILNNVVKTKIQLLNKEAEVTFLKQQLSPHFLFNAINNLYGTSLAAPHLVSDKILELSDLLRYQVEATTKTVVSMEEEQVFVANYINYTTYKSNDLWVTNKTVGEILPFKIPPLLFLPLLENAVKYAVETEKAFIHILWAFDKNSLSFFIENTYLEAGGKMHSTKIGLDNLKKRLELLELKHSLKTDISTPNIYKIELKIWELPINA